MDQKLDYIDTLRGLAIVGVLMTHCAQYGGFNVPYILQNWIGNGARGVQLFFVVSAFTTFLSFRRRYNNERSPIQNFFIRRFFRIAPMYYLGVIYYLWQDGLGQRYWLGDAEGISMENILSNIFFIHGFNPYWINSLVPGGWSIAVETTFYILLPVIASQVKNINHAVKFVLIACGINIILQNILTIYPLISSTRLWSEYLFLYFPSQLPIFALGVVMYFIIIPDKPVSNILSPKVFLTLALLFIVVLGSGINIIPSYLVFGGAFFTLGIALSKYKFTLLNNSFINYLGKISFSLYLVHFAVLHWLNEYSLVDYFDSQRQLFGIINYIVRFLIVILISAIISSIFYKLIEVPFQKIGKRLIAILEKEARVVEIPV